MARRLHIRLAETLYLTAVWVCMSAGCVVSPPIDAEPIAPERSPRLDFKNPSDRIVTVTDENEVTLSVRAFDENPHDFLFVVWVGQELGPRVDSVPRQSDLLEDGELEYRFDVIDRTIAPCSELDGVSEETVTVFVGDSALDLTGNDVQLSDPGGGGFLTSTSWILDIQPGACL